MKNSKKNKIRDRNFFLSLLSLIISFGVLTFSIWNSYEQDKKVAYPYLELKLLSSDKLDFIIQNIGNGVAKEIEIQYKINLENYAKDEDDFFMQYSPTKKYYIDNEILNLKEEETFSLKVGDKNLVKVNYNIKGLIDLFLENKITLKEIKNKEIFSITIKYLDLFDRKYECKYIYKLEEYVNVEKKDIKLVVYKLIRKN